MVVFEVNEVTLYKMGIGWLSSKASFQNKKVLFPVLVKNQDDFLKTFHVEVEGEALLSSIAFDTEESKDLQIDQDGYALTSILNLLSGSKIVIVSDNKESIRGRLIGYQTVKSGNDSDTLKVKIVLSTEDDSIQYFDSNRVISILPVEEFYRKTLTEQLDFLSRSKKENVKNLKISFTEEGEKNVTVSYLTELPAWLSSYRIYSLDDENAVFELWSLVTNNSQQDWIDANLHLITGLPISFRYDISSPWLIDRPFVQRPRQMGISVMTPEAEYKELAKPASPPMAVAGIPMKKAKRSRAVSSLKMADEFLEEEPYEYAVGAAESAEIVTTTESVSFSLKQPVTIKKGESALLLLHNTNIPKKTIYIYNQEQHTTHPFKAIEVENVTGYGWEEGPVTIYEKGAYTGEAMLQRVSKGEKQILPYLVEQDVIIKQNETSSSKKISISISGQYYVETFLNTRLYTLEINNKADEDKLVICEVPKLYDYKLDKKKSKVETKETPNYFRAEILVEPKTLIKIKIPTLRKTSESISIASISDEYLDDLLNLETLTDKQVNSLKKIKQIRKEKIQINEQISSEQTNLNRIDKEYQRITQSINVLTSEGEEGKTRAKYVERMNNLFETMENKRTEIEKLQERSSKIDEEIYDLLEKL
ncbi:MAG: hypothetical protein KAS63_08895 [Candidatus Heimdallarchaeota archaeon]|nr:hypothetical protein [Candidatus Heimdallarchaeota archaeon]MCK4955465.1 hypothetical protein [Candidatus Heimdallarchaeota archaeon]